MDDVYYIIGTAYAGKSTMVKLLAEKYDGIACEENYHDSMVDEKLDIPKIDMTGFSTWVFKFCCMMITERLWKHWRLWKDC